MNLFLLLSFIIGFTNSMLVIDDQAHEITAARCYSKCLQIFIRFKSLNSMSQTGPENVTRSLVDDQGTQLTAFVDEIAHQLLVSKPDMLSCLNDTKNRCSKQCIQSCSTVVDCICQTADIGCLLACHFRKEIMKESSQDECPMISALEETALKNSISQCPKSCKSKSDCNLNQLCCAVESCEMICLQIEKRKTNLPKYKPTPTKLNTSVIIEFDWSNTFKPYLNKESPLVFILQTRSCLCHEFNEKYATPWQTLIRTHILRVELDTFEKGTIYQFRLASVAHNGSDGFGPISDNLPTVISKPPLPLPPENVIDYKWQITDENKFHVEIKWKKSVDPFWRSYEFQISWMVDHGVAQPDGEPLSSLTQYSKTLPGSDDRCTIDDLKPATTYKIQIIVKSFWPGFGFILSVPSTMYITTPATSDSTEISETINSNSKNKDCSCPDKYSNGKDFKIRTSNQVNRNLQVIIDVQKYSDYLVEGYPEVCIHTGNENLSKSIQRFRKIYKQTNQIVLSNLRYNCRYSVELTSVSGNLPNTTYQLCFCTPTCNNNNNQYQSKYCHKEDISIPSPKEPRSVLINLDTMTYKISWKATHRISQRSRILDVAKYRISWAPRKFEPVRIEHYLGTNGFKPIIDFDQSDVRIVHSNVTLFLLHNLTKQQLYIVRIQSLGMSPNGEIIESFPATILLPTFGYSDDFFTKSSQKSCSIYLLFLMCSALSHKLLAS